MFEKKVGIPIFAFLLQGRVRIIQPVSRFYYVKTMSGIIGKKIGMTSMYSVVTRCCPSSRIRTAPCLSLYLCEPLSSGGFAVSHVNIAGPASDHPGFTDTEVGVRIPNSHPQILEIHSRSDQGTPALCMNLNQYTSA